MFKAIEGYEPTRKTKYSAGFDIRARGEHIIAPQEVKIIKTGVWLNQNDKELMVINKGVVFLLAIRSSLAKKGIILANGVGVIDADYPDEIGVMLLNLSGKEFHISDKERIAQILIVPHLAYHKVDGVIYGCETRTGGFGSTGKH